MIAVEPTLDDQNIAPRSWEYSQQKRIALVPVHDLLSMISALTRLGLDPWQEAGRLSSLARREAVEQLARLIAEIPGVIRPVGEAPEIADRLVSLLPKHDDSRAATPQVQIRPRYSGPMLPRPSQFWLACFVLAAAVLVSAIVHGGFMFGIGIP